MATKKLTEAQEAVLTRLRDGGSCIYVSIRGVYVITRSANSDHTTYHSFSARTIQVLRKRGLITLDVDPIITDAGRAALNGD